jgi:hypothetical protein
MALLRSPSPAADPKPDFQQSEISSPADWAPSGREAEGVRPGLEATESIWPTMVKPFDGEVGFVFLVTSIRPTKGAGSKEGRGSGTEGRCYDQESGRWRRRWLRGRGRRASLSIRRRADLDYSRQSVP